MVGSREYKNNQIELWAVEEGGIKKKMGQICNKFEIFENNIAKIRAEF